MVEMALILPIILLLLMGMVEFSRIFGSYLLITHASREGARMASIGKGDDEVIQRVTDRSGVLNTADLQVTLTPDEDVRRSGDDVKVSVKYKIVIYAPIISSILPNPFEMESITYMRVE